MKHLPNILSFTRIVLSVALIFFPVFSWCFYLLYILSGITDMLDGAIARKVNACTEFGAKLDSFGDLVFIAVCLPKILLAVKVPVWVWICTAIIALVRIFNLVYGFVIYRRIIMLHTVPNKISGFILFVFPLSLALIDINYAAIPVCAVTFFSAAHEGVLIVLGKFKDSSKNQH